MTLAVINDDADNSDESVDDITAAATAPSPMYATAFGHKYFNESGRIEDALAAEHLYN